MFPDPSTTTSTIALHGWAHGGEAVGRLPDGRACFVADAIPGEVVEVRIRTMHKRHATADLVAVIEASPDRVEPPCPYVQDCGGCQLQHIAPPRQLELKAQVLRDTLQRIGREADPPVRSVKGPDGAWPEGYRAWARMAVDDEGRLGFRRRRSHDVVHVPTCLLMTESAQALRESAGDRWSGAEEVTLMTGADGDVITLHGSTPPELPPGTFGVAVQDDGGVVVQREPGAVVMQVGDMRLQASAGAFFQAGPAAADLLVRTVHEVIDVRVGDHVLDLYSGVGLFSVALARRGARVTAVEANAQACRDARVNAEGLPVTVIAADTATALRGLTDAVDVVLLDPPRTGAREEVCRLVAALSPRQVVYVACDPAALARDTVTLRAEGYILRSVDGLDLFGHTAHVEAVAVFDRDS